MMGVREPAPALCAGAAKNSGSGVERLIAGVVERSLAGIDSRLAIRLGAFRRIPDGDPLGIAFEPASHICFLLSPASAPAAGRASCYFHSRATFFAVTSHPNPEVAAQIPDARAERAAGCDRAKAARGNGAACLYGVHCRCFCLLISERGTEHFFPRPLTRSGGRGKNVVEGGDGFRIRDAKPRRSAEAGQDSFPWPTTPSRRANQ
jgi:hypothetical protein